MEVNLLYKDKNEIGDSGYEFKNDITKDLQLDILLHEMARSDSHIASVARNVMLRPLLKEEDITYRQSVVMDCINHSKGFIDFYQETIDTKKELNRVKLDETRVKRQGTKMMQIFQSLEYLKILIRHLEQLKSLIGMYETDFTSSAMIRFCQDFLQEFNYDTVSSMKKAIDEMNFLTEGGVISLSGSIGAGMKCTNLIVNHIEKYEEKKMSFLTETYYAWFKPNVVLLKDQAMTQDARQMEEAGLYHILKIYGSFIKYLTDFFDAVHFQLAFYVGCLNLYNRTLQYHTPICMPSVAKKGSDIFEADGLYDLVLALDTRNNPVGNKVSLTNKDLLIITGANQGGKSTFLRSLGIAQVMMQAGMFVPARQYTSCLFECIFTHFTRREDASMNSGKLEEELIRMSHIIDETRKNSLILLNEPFATTTEKEGSIIAFDITRALYEAQIKTFIVTHLFAYSKQMYQLNLEKAYFLGAERLSDGTRTYRMVEHEPKETSYGMDLFERVLGERCE